MSLGFESDDFAQTAFLSTSQDIASSFLSYFLFFTVPCSLHSAALAGIFKVLFLSIRGRSHHWFQSYGEECEAVAQWCHLAARQGCTGGGTQRWRWLWGRWVIPHMLLLPIVRFHGWPLSFGLSYVQSAALSLLSSSEVQFCLWIQCVTVVIFHMCLSYCKLV